MDFVRSSRAKLVYIKELDALVQEDLVGDVLESCSNDELPQENVRDEKNGGFRSRTHQSCSIMREWGR